MQQQLDQIYIVLCKNYANLKKEKVREMKQQYCGQLFTMIQQYRGIQVISFIEKFVPLFRDKIRLYE